MEVASPLSFASSNIVGAAPTGSVAATGNINKRALSHRSSCGSPPCGSSSSFSMNTMDACSGTLLLGGGGGDSYDGLFRRDVKRRRLLDPSAVDSLSEVFSSHSPFNTAAAATPSTTPTTFQSPTNSSKKNAAATANPSSPIFPSKNMTRTKTTSTIAATMATLAMTPLAAVSVVPTSSSLNKHRLGNQSNDSSSNSDNGGSTTPRSPRLSSQSHTTHSPPPVLLTAEQPQKQRAEEILASSKTLIESLTNEKTQLTSDLDATKTTLERCQKENTLLRRAIVIQQDRHEQDASSLLDAQERIRVLEQMVLTLRIHLQQQQQYHAQNNSNNNNNSHNNPMNPHDFFGGMAPPRPPDVF